MSKLKNLIVTEMSTWVEYPDIDGFEVELVYLSRDELAKIRSRALTYKFNKRTRQREEEIDNDKFLEEYAKKAIRNWKGLKVKDLPKLLPVNISGASVDEEIQFTEEDALDMIKNSTVFDQFITDCMNDFEQFSIKEKEVEEKN